MGRKLASLLAAVLIVVAAIGVTTRHASASAADPPAATSHTITWDKYSLMVDGKRTFLWSGEFHAFRLPSPDLWRDILQKMKANGYDAVSIYFDWAYHSPKQGVYDFTGVRDMDKLLDIANQVGIYVIARPGPYINAEVDSGGYPGWLQETSGTARTNNATYMSYTDEYMTQIDAILARHQLTNGTGSVILYQIENEYAGSNTAYMQHLYNKARADGITVPIFHNDKGRTGAWVPGSFTGDDGQPGPNLYGFDSYPGGTCSTSGTPGTPATPPDYGYYGSGGKTGGSTASPNTPGLTAEFGGGWFDPWGDALFNGKGYDCQATREGAAYERDYYLTNVANGLKIQNIYMTFGGTNWGWLAAPVVYTSYDYGAAWNEARQPRDKVTAMKELGYFVQSVDPVDKLDAAGTVTASNASVKVYHLTNPDTGTAFYFVRHATQSSSDLKFTVPITTADGSYTIPQSGQLELNGEDMKALVADYDMDSQHLVYSTADLMTHGTIDGQDVALFDGRNGQQGETVLRYASAPTVNVLQGSGVTTNWDPATGNLRIDYTLSGLAEIQITGGGGNAKPLLLMATDDTTAATLWRQDTSAGMVIERGPSLVRTATVAGDTLDLTGDDKAASDLEVWAPAAVKNVTWNGQAVTTTTTPSGSLAATTQVPGPAAVTLPALTNWKYHQEDAGVAAVVRRLDLAGGQQDVHVLQHGADGRPARPLRRRLRLPLRRRLVPRHVQRQRRGHRAEHQVPGGHRGHDRGLAGRPVPRRQPAADADQRPVDDRDLERHGALRHPGRPADGRQPHRRGPVPDDGPRGGRRRQQRIQERARHPGGHLHQRQCPHQLEDPGQPGRREHHRHGPWRGQQRRPLRRARRLVSAGLPGRELAAVHAALQRQHPGRRLVPHDVRPRRAGRHRRVAGAEHHRPGRQAVPGADLPQRLEPRPVHQRRRAAAHVRAAQRHPAHRRAQHAGHRGDHQQRRRRRHAAAASARSRWSTSAPWRAACK